MQRVARGRGWYRRRATVIVQVAVASTLMLGMGALAVDVGILYTARSEIQLTADAAALAAAAELAGRRAGDVRDNAIAAADRFAQLNKVMGITPRVLPNDVEFGRAMPSGATFRFAPADSNWDAVRVTIRHMESGVPDNPAALNVPLALARVFGVSGEQLQARAAAVLVPRDIAVVIDLSASMNDDSELQHYKRYLGERGQWRDGIHVNLRDIWCALDGPAPARPYVPGAEGQTQYAADTGPAIGAMNTWGNPVVPETYSPSSDPGLWYIPKGSTCNVAAARTSLQARGYSTDEINCLFSGAQDSRTNPPQYVNRTAVILGLATWNSGRTGGRPGGNGDVYVDNSELSWTAYPSWRRNWTWKNYIDYVSSTSTAMYSANSGFRYRYGLKTFVNFLLENQPRYNQTTVLYQTPEQPLQAVKDAVQALVDEIESLESMDQLSLEIFGQTARHEVDLTLDLQSVANRLYQMQAGHYDGYTNMGGGLQRAIAELTSARARAAAAKVILLMSDGKPNVDASGAYRGFCAEVDAWVCSVAQQAADMNMRIYTISVGSDADLELMASLAQIGHGEYFHAEGTPAEYAEQLDEIFRTLGGKRPVQLIE